jgi:hemerythrin-like domain-containing protein
MADADDPRSALSQAKEELLDEHRKVMEMTRRVETAPDLVELIRRLGEFRSLLESHFSTEEDGEGLFDTIRAIAPQHYGRLAQLEKEHRAFIGEIERIAERARACLEGPVADVMRGARELTRRLSDHEATENQLLFDTLYMDMGQGD